MTKRPFNALPPVIDVNNALVSLAVTGYAGFSTAAGFVGPKFRVDHDISMLVPEIWCRMTPAERDPAFLIDNGYLEKVEDFTFRDRLVPASRLGYRITRLFVDRFFGRIFETPDTVLSEPALRPEQQDLEMFADGIEAIVEAQRTVALEYFQDGSIDAACPPVKAVLHLMAHGNYLGMTAEDPGFRALFTRESVLAGDWYRDRLRAKQTRDIALWTRHVRSLSELKAAPDIAQELKIADRLAEARRQLERVQGPRYLEELSGTIGADVALGEPSAVPLGSSVPEEQTVIAGSAR